MYFYSLKMWYTMVIKSKVAKGEYVIEIKDKVVYYICVNDNPTHFFY